MLTSKQRAYLRGLANQIETIFQLGKDGITDNFIDSIIKALEKRELVKIKVLENALTSAKEAASEIADATSSEVVQVIGNKIVLYKESKENKKIIF